VRRRKPVAVEAPVDVIRPAPVKPPVDDAYGRFAHELAVRCSDRILDAIEASPALSERAKLVDKAVTLAGSQSAEWYVTTEYESDDDDGPGLGSLLRQRSASGSPISEEEFSFVTVVCTFFYLFAVMADRDRLSAAATFVEAIGAPVLVGDVADDLEHAFPTRRPSPRPATTFAAYLTKADRWLAEYLGVDNSPGLSARQAATVTQRFNACYLENVLPALNRVS
jgi:hypothetical protein